MTKTCGLCRDCKHWGASHSVGLRRCDNEDVGLFSTPPDFGCVLFEAKPPPKQRIVGVCGLPNISHSYACESLQPELDAGGLVLTETWNYTHVATKGPQA